MYHVDCNVSGEQGTLLGSCKTVCVASSGSCSALQDPLAATAILFFNPLMPNGHYSCCTAPLTSRCCMLNIYSTNIHTEYFKHAT
jgi:hypothetical protein